MAQDPLAAILTPGIVLSLLVGAFHTCLYLVIRAQAGRQLLLVLPAAVIGAWAGNALASRLGDALRLGDHGLLWASILAWAGILVVTAPGRVRSQPGSQRTPARDTRPPRP
jgi:hypothetical protein